MARLEQLGTLITRLRSEVQQSTQPNLGQNYRDVLVNKLQGAQEFLYHDFFWPFLKTTGDKTLQAGSRYYDLPTGFQPDRVVEIRQKWSGIWGEPIERGITLDHYNAMDSDLDVRSDPVQAWDFRDNSGACQVEVWPVPASNQTNALRFIGKRALKPFVADNDLCDIDGQLLVLWAAADILGRYKAGELTIVGKRAQDLYLRLKGNYSRKPSSQTPTFGMTPGSDRSLREKVILVAKA